RLFDVPERARLNRRHRPFFASFARDDDRGHVANFFPKLLQQVQAVHARQFHIGNQCIGLEIREFRQCVFRRRHPQHFVSPPLQQLLVTLPGIVFIFDNQDTVFVFPGFHCPYRSLLFCHALGLTLPISCLLLLWAASTLAISFPLCQASTCPGVVPSGVALVATAFCLPAPAGGGCFSFPLESTLARNREEERGGTTGRAVDKTDRKDC